MSSNVWGGGREGGGWGQMSFSHFFVADILGQYGWKRHFVLFIKVFNETGMPYPGHQTILSSCDK